MGIFSKKPKDTQQQPQHSTHKNPVASATMYGSVQNMNNIPSIGYDGSKTLGALSVSNIDPSSLNREALRYHSNKQYFKNSIAHNIIETKVTSIIGSGAFLESRPMENIIGRSLGKKDFKIDKDWTSYTEDSWFLWASHTGVDYNFMRNFNDMCIDAFREYLLNGKSITIARYIPSPRKGRLGRLCLQGIPVKKLCTPALERVQKKANGEDIINGIHVDKNGTVIGYYFSESENFNVLSKDYTYVPRWGEKTGRLNVIDVTKKSDQSDIEGMPDLTPILQDLQDIEEYRISEIIAAKINASIALIQNSDGSQPNPQMKLGVGTRTNSIIDGDGNEQTTVTHQVPMPGMHVYASKAGQKLESYRTDRPNVNFGSFVAYSTSQASSSVSLPYEILEKKFGSNYSASRAALLEYFRYVAREFAYFSHQYCQPIYELWLSDEIWSGRISAQGWDSEDLMQRAILRRAWAHTEWNGPIMGSVDPKKENEAAKVAEDRGWTTAESNARRLYGKDFDYNIIKRKEEARMQEESFVVEKKSSGGN